MREASAIQSQKRGMRQRRSLARNAEANAEHADAPVRASRVRRLMQEEGRRQGFAQHVKHTDDGPDGGWLSGELAVAVSSGSSWEQHSSATSSSSTRLPSDRQHLSSWDAHFRTSPEREAEPANIWGNRLNENLRRTRESRGQGTAAAASAPREQLQRPRSQGTIDSTSQRPRSSARSQPVLTAEQRPASAGSIRRPQEINQGRRLNEADQGRRLHEADARRPSRRTRRQPDQTPVAAESPRANGHQDAAINSSQVSSRPEEAPDFRISLAGPGLQVALAGMEPFMLATDPMEAQDGDDVHPLITVARQIEMATTLMRLIEDQSMEEQLMRAVMEESAQESLRSVLEQSINEQQREHTVPPVKEGILDSLPHVVVTKEDLLDETNAQCSICLEKHTCGARATRILCGHLFCTNCIAGWLNSANSCPVCRYELPTDREDFEAGRIERMRGRKACLKEGDLVMMDGAALKRLMSAMEIPTGCSTGKDDLLNILRTHPNVQISLDRPGVSYEEADVAKLDSDALVALLQRHRIPLPSPHVQKREHLMRPEVLRRFEAAGLLASSSVLHVAGASKAADPKPATPDNQEKQPRKLRSSRKPKKDGETKPSRLYAAQERMSIQGRRMSVDAGTSEDNAASLVLYSAASSSAVEPEAEGDCSDAERKASRGRLFPARSSNAARCWEPAKSMGRTLSTSSLRIDAACSDAVLEDPIQSAPVGHTMSTDSADAPAAHRGHWFARRPSSLSPGLDSEKGAEHGGQRSALLGRPSKFVQRMRRSFKFGGV